MAVPIQNQAITLAAAVRVKPLADQATPLTETPIVPADPPSSLPT